LFEIFSDLTAAHRFHPNSFILSGAASPDQLSGNHIETGKRLGMQKGKYDVGMFRR
jgi:hypothetical protein